MAFLYQKPIISHVVVVVVVVAAAAAAAVVGVVIVVFHFSIFQIPRHQEFSKNHPPRLGPHPNFWGLWTQPSAVWPVSLPGKHCSKAWCLNGWKSWGTTGTTFKKHQGDDDAAESWKKWMETRKLNWKITEVEIHEINLGGVSDIFGFFSPKIGEMIQFDYFFLNGLKPTSIDA